MIIFLPLIFLLNYIIFLFIGISTNYHTNSLYGIITTTICIFLINLFSKDLLVYQKIDAIFYDKVLKPLLAKKITFLFIFIILLNALINITGFIILHSKIDYSKFNLSFDINNYILASMSLSILMAQIGGLFLQAILLFCLTIIFDLEINFHEILKITSIGYLGFLITSVFLFFYNYFLFNEQTYLPNSISAQISTSNLVPAIGKFGEYLTLSLIFCLFVGKNISIRKSFTIAVLPSFLVLLFIQLFQYATL